MKKDKEIVLELETQIKGTQRIFIQSSLFFSAHRHYAVIIAIGLWLLLCVSDPSEGQYCDECIACSDWIIGLPDG